MCSKRVTQCLKASLTPFRPTHLSCVLPLQNLSTSLCFPLQEAPFDYTSSSCHSPPSGIQCLGQSKEVGLLWPISPALQHCGQLPGGPQDPGRRRPRLPSCPGSWRRGSSVPGSAPSPRDRTGTDQLQSKQCHGACDSVLGFLLCLDLRAWDWVPVSAIKSMLSKPNHNLCADEAPEAGSQSL